MSYTPAHLTGSRLTAPQDYVSGNYYYPGGPQTTASSATLGNGMARVGAWEVRRTLSISAFNAEVATIGEAGSLFRIGVWNADGSGGAPVTVACDAGTIAGDGSTGVKEIVLGSTLVLAPGLYWIGGAVQNAPTTQPTMRTISAPILPGGPLGTSIPGAATVFAGFLASGVTGALGDFSPRATSSAAAARIGFKVA